MAGDGQSAVGALVEAASRPDVVLLDYRLPDSDGLTLFTTIRDLHAGRPGHPDDRVRQPGINRQGAALGAYRVVTKPFEVTDVAAMIRHASAATPA